MLIWNPFLAALFLFDPKADFNAHIDAPAEAETIIVPHRGHELGGNEPKAPQSGNDVFEHDAVETSR